MKKEVAFYILMTGLSIGVFTSFYNDVNDTFLCSPGASSRRRLRCSDRISYKRTNGSPDICNTYFTGACRT